MGEREVWVEFDLARVRVRERERECERGGEVGRQKVRGGEAGREDGRKAERKVWGEGGGRVMGWGGIGRQPRARV